MKKKNLKPFTIEELNERIEQSEKDFEEGRYKSTAELLGKYSTEDNTLYLTSREEKDAISEAREQIKNKETIANSALQKEISEWLEI